jgi:hypothetical protein
VFASSCPITKEYVSSKIFVICKKFVIFTCDSSLPCYIFVISKDASSYSKFARNCEVYSNNGFNKYIFIAQGVGWLVGWLVNLFYCYYFYCSWTTIYAV